MPITNTVHPTDAAPTGAPPEANPVQITGIGHVAVNTADLARFRRFYEQILGIPLGVTMRMPVAPHLRHAFFHVAPGVILHAFEVPGYDPRAQGIGTDIGERGRVDHFAFLVPDEQALEAVASRLRAAGASDGAIRDFGALLSVHATDPDGLQFEVTCANVSYDPRAESEEVEEIGVPDWVSMVSAPPRG
jgi:catechol 2,3-dioxygenase-like lactoylglutathione lyase family enzyme